MEIFVGRLLWRKAQLTVKVKQTSCPGAIQGEGMGVENIDNGLYQAGTFKSFVPYNQFDAYFKPADGYIFYRDAVSQAPYAYSATREEFATFDDAESVEAKTKFAQKKGLGGIMFWQLGSDKADNGLLQAIFKALKPN